MTCFAGVVKSGVAAVAASGMLAAASLGVAPSANALCVNISGLNLGTGCKASFGSIAIVLGPDTGTAVAGGGTQLSPFNIAISVGDGTTRAGESLQPSYQISIGNVAFATSGTGAQSEGLLSLSVSLGGYDNSPVAVGVGSSTFVVGGSNNTTVRADGFFNNATVLFGDSNVVETESLGTGLAGFLSGFNVVFSIFGNFNGVTSAAVVGGNGPLSIAGAIGVSHQTVINTNFGIHVSTPFTVPAAAPAVLAAGNKVAAKALAAAGGTQADSQSSGPVQKAGSQSNGSLKKAGKQVSSSSPSSLRKKAADTVSKAAKTTKASAGQ